MSSSTHTGIVDENTLNVFSGVELEFFYQVFPVEEIEFRKTMINKIIRKIKQAFKLNFLQLPIYQDLKNLIKWDLHKTTYDDLNFLNQFFKLYNDIKGYCTYMQRLTVYDIVHEMKPVFNGYFFFDCIYEFDIYGNVLIKNFYYDNLNYLR